MNTLISQAVEETLEEAFGKHADAEECMDRVRKQRRLDEIIAGTLWKDTDREKRRAA